MYDVLFFTNVLRLLDERKITKQQLADHAGISISFLSDLTNGKANPSLKILEAIASALEVPLASLLESTDASAETMRQLAGGVPIQSVPEGYCWVSALLTDYQAYTVQQWDTSNRKQLSQGKSKN